MTAGDRRNTWVAIATMALLSGLAARFVARVALGDVPHVMDEIAYVFQAKLFAAGRLTAPVVTPRAAFNMWFIEDRAARYAIFPPGWPAVLALGVRASARAWVNPILHAATIAVIGRAGRVLGGSRLSLTSALLYAASPQAILLAASLMSHTLVALAGAVVTLAVAEIVASGRARGGLLAAAGCALGIAAATRPLCALVLGIAFVVAIAARAQPKTRHLAIAGASALPGLLGLLAYNRALTGSALRFVQTAYFDEHLAPANLPFFAFSKGCSSLGFGRACDHAVKDALHTPLTALTDVGDNLQSWLGLACGPILVVGVVLAFQRREPRRYAPWLLMIPLGSIALYMLYWHAGICYGARFYHAALPALLLLVGCGLAALPRRWFAAAIAAAWIGNVAGFAVAWRELSSWPYWGTDDRFAVLAKHLHDAHDARSVVMVAFGSDDVKNPALRLTAMTKAGTPWIPSIRSLAALGQNDPLVDRDEIVFAKFHPALASEIAARFPDRALYLYVAWADRAKDTLVRWDPATYATAAYARPPDNFDGFRIAPPDDPPEPLQAPPPGESWPLP